MLSRLGMLALGGFLGLSLARNLPPIAHPAHGLVPLLAGLLLFAAYRAGRSSSGSTAEASAEATATSSSTAAVNVVVVPAAYDPAVIAQQLGTRAYVVDAPQDVAEVAAQGVPLFDLDTHTPAPPASSALPGDGAARQRGNKRSASLTGSAGVGLSEGDGGATAAPKRKPTPRRVAVTKRPGTVVS